MAGEVVVFSKTIISIFSGEIKMKMNYIEITALPGVIKFGIKNHKVCFGGKS